MSLIVARRDENLLSIVSDTKLTHPDHEVKGLKTKASDGVIKTIIVNPDVCVSFAGEIDAAKKALMEIQADCTIDIVIEILKRYHIQSKYQTEFILCFSKPQLIIYKFKNNEYGPVVSAWIGDQKAFSRFQEYMNGNAKPSKKEKKRHQSPLPKPGGPKVFFKEMNLTMEVSVSKYISKMSSAMDSVIEEGNVESVGGFKVNVIFKDKFYYNSYCKNYRGEFAIEGVGSHLIGHGNAQEGAYSINFFGGSSDFKSVAVHIKQGGLGVLYHRVANDLPYPQIFEMDEVDFSDYVSEKYNLFAQFSTQDKAHKFYFEGRKAFDQKDFEKAKSFFDKTVQNSKNKQKAEALFYKGLTLLNLRDVPNASIAFQEAVNIDPGIKQKIDLIVQREK